MPATFRATRKYWLNEIIGPILLVLVCALVVLALDERRGLPLAIIAGIGSLTFLWTAILTWRTQLLVDDQGLRGRLHNRLLDLRWSDMHALRVVFDGQKKSWLQIGTVSGGAQFLLDELDVTGVQRALERYAPPMILAADAFDRLPWAQEQRAADAALLAGVTGPVRVRVSAWVPIVGWLGIVFFSSIGYLAWRDGSGIAGLLLVLFGLLEGYLLYVGYAVTEIGSETIRLTMPIWPTYEMWWDEVQLAEVDHGNNQFVLQGAGKQMTLPGPAYWRGADKEVGLAAFIGHLEKRNIPLKRTGVAYFKFSKGTRVRRTGGKL
jgi:hypothetical protein